MEQYTVVAYTMPHELSAAVNELIQQGWKPLGGVSITLVASRIGRIDAKDEYMLAQALTR